MQLYEHTEKASEATQLPKANGQALPDPQHGIEGSATPDPLAILHAQKALVEHLCRLIAKRWIEAQGDALEK